MLFSGLNYLWISTDIKTSAMPAAVIDAEVTALTVNGALCCHWLHQHPEIK